jgi:hypothetical protein
MKAVIADIEDRDHRIFVVNPGAELADAIWEQMEADGYKFACSPMRDKLTRERKIYFVRQNEPALRM